jgi:hypothetical protein
MWEQYPSGHPLHTCHYHHISYGRGTGFVGGTTGPQPFRKLVLHVVRSSAFYFNFQCSFARVSSFSTNLRLVLRLLVTSVLPSIFPSVTCWRRQYLRKMKPIPLAFLHITVCRIFLFSLTLCNTSSFLTRSLQLIFPIILQHEISKLPRYFWSTFRSVQVSSPYKAVLQM